MKIFLENEYCNLHIRVHFQTDKNSFPAAHIQNLFCFEGYVHVTEANSGQELPLSPDCKSYLLPPRTHELELFLAGNEVVRSDSEVSARQLEILAYANKYKITVEVLHHPEVAFSINAPEKTLMTKAFESAKTHIDIARQATGTTILYQWVDSFNRVHRDQPNPSRLSSESQTIY